MRRAAAPWWAQPRRALWAFALLVVGTAQAQVGASIGVDSDYRFRGISLSDGRPDLRIGLAYDHASGAFAGAAATQVEFTRGRHALQVLGYAGYALRLAPGLGAEVGATRSTFRGATRYNYTEVFAGVLSERWSLRAYHASHYFGFGQATVYLELDAHAPLTSRLRVFGHAGALGALSSREGDDRRRMRTDLRAGLGFGAGAVDVQLAWVTATRGGPYVVEYGTRRSTFVLSALASF